MKLLFNGDLTNIYSDIYLLVSRLHFTPEYIESISPVERDMFLLEHMKEMKKEQEDNTEQPTSNLLKGPLEYT